MEPRSAPRRSGRIKQVALIAIPVLATVFLPLIPFGFNEALACERSGLPCPLYRPTFLSVTAYYYRVGAYVTSNGYGLMGIQWLLLSLLILTLLITILLARTRDKSKDKSRPC